MSRQRQCVFTAKCYNWNVIVLTLNFMFEFKTHTHIDFDGRVRFNSKKIKITNVVKTFWRSEKQTNAGKNVFQPK